VLKDILFKVALTAAMLQGAKNNFADELPARRE